MILKKQAREADRKASPWIGLLLLLTAVVLTIITVPFGLLYGFIHAAIRKGFTGVGEYALKIAVSIDQLGNVIMQHLLNVLWIRKGGYRFGNRDETISSALGRNRQLGTLTGFGKFIDKVLDTIDPNHSLNSIDYYIEPVDLVERLTFIAIRDGKILVVRYGGKDQYELPGAMPVPGTADAVALGQALHRQLNIQVPAGAFSYLHTFEYKLPQDQKLRQTCYSANYVISPEPKGPIAEVEWLGPERQSQMLAQDREIIAYLEDKSLI